MARIGGSRAAAPVIATKIAIPRRRSDTLRRARLVDAIHHMIDRPLYLIVAPAGYGKTTLLVDFASDGDIPVCWYSLTPSDAEPAVFLEYLVATIQARYPRFGAETRRAMAQTDFRADAMAVVAALVNEVQERIPDYFAVILDDYHEVNDSGPVNQLVDALLKHAPENLKLIIASRTMPRLQLSRLAALRQAAGVGAKDLRFTSGEVRDLMREAYQTVLPDRVVEELTARSEGWITGIILTTHTMWQGLFESMIQNSGQEQLYGYLANEVFERQPESVQRFLLASSILDDMEPAIAGPLAGVTHADTVLRKLDEGNLFVSELEGRRRVYRYHHLFRDFLRSRLDEQALGLSRAELERRAGLLYQQKDQHEQAIGHLLAAEAFDEAATSILAIAEDTFNRGRLETLAAWIDGLPEDLRACERKLAVWRAQVAIQRGELDSAAELCRQVETAEGIDSALRAEAKAHRAGVLRLQGNNDGAIELAREAIASFGSEVSRRRALAIRVVGMTLWRLGDLGGARTELEQSLELLAAAGDEASVAYVHNDLGAVAIFDGRLVEAQLHLRRAASLMQSLGNTGRWGLTLSNLGVISYLEEDYENAIRLFRLASEKGENGLFPHTVVVARTSLGDVYRDTGSYAEAERCYEAALPLAEQLVDRGELLALLWSRAESYRQQRLYPKAQVILRRLTKTASGYRLAQAQMLDGICALEQGRFVRARELLTTALAAFRARGNRYQAARALFHLSMLEYETKHAPKGDAHLRESLRILEELGYSQFLAVDGPHWEAVLAQAAERGVGEEFLVRKLRRLRSPAFRPRTEPISLKSRAPATVTVRTFGGFEVALDGKPVSPRQWGTQAARELFVYLLLQGGRASKDRMMLALAPDASPARANSQFHVAAYRVRKALYRTCIKFDGDSYQLDPDLQIDFDAAAFREAIARANTVTPGSDAEREGLEEALNRYRGQFFPSSYAEWIMSEQRRLEDEFVDATSRLALLRFERGEFQEAIAAAERGLAADNSLEELHEMILRALVGQGRRVDAGRHLDRYAEYLDREFGSEVPPELRELVAGQTKPRLLAAR